MSYTLHLGDCLDILPTLASGSVDAVVTDPPYGIGYASNWKFAPDGTPRKTGAAFGADEFDPRWIPEAYRVLKADSFLYCFTRWDMAGLWLEEFKRVGFVPVQRLIWDKCHWKMGDLGNYGSQVEDVLLFAKGRAIMFDGGKGRGGNIFRYSSAFLPEGQYDHPTQKPVNLLRRYIVDATRYGDTVCDPFVGSGSAGVAAILEGRRFVGVEISPTYHAIAVKRCADAAAQPFLIPHVEQPQARQEVMEL